MQTAEESNRVRVSLAAVALALAGARAASACSGDDLPKAAPDGAVSDLDGAAGDAEPSQDGEGPVPAFCEGIVLYASLDTGFAPEVGAVQTLPSGETRASAEGRFGGAVSLRADASVDAGACLFFVNPEGGPPVFPEAMGTVSLWYRGDAFSADALPSPVLTRPTASLPEDPVVGSGLAFLGIGSGFGLVNTPPNRANENVFVFPKAQVLPFLRAGEFNHFAAAWRRDVTGLPTALMALNGGLGTLFDAGPDAMTYADAAPNDAGDLPVPYRGYTTRRWENDASTRAFRLGGTAGSSSQGEIDDVAVWNRVLSFDEIAAVYAANAPLGQVCRLR